MESQRFWRCGIYSSSIQLDMETGHCAVQQVSLQQMYKPGTAPFIDF